MVEASAGASEEAATVARDAAAAVAVTASLRVPLLLLRLLRRAMMMSYRGGLDCGGSSRRLAACLPEQCSTVEHACIDACMLHSVDVLGAAQRAATKQDEEAFSIRIAKCRKTKYFPRITLA